MTLKNPFRNNPQPDPDDQPIHDVTPPDDEATDAATVNEDPVALVQRELDDVKDRLLRTMADYQNYARRAQQNVTEAHQQATADLAKALLSVLDHFDRALEIDPEKTSAQDLLKGVQIVRDELLRMLDRFEVRRMDVQRGEDFDPARHEALMHQADEKLDANQITTVLAPGYQIGQRTLRPAKVAVAQ